MNRLLATVGTVAFLTAGSAFAQTMNSETYSQMRDHVSTELAALGVDREVGTFTMDELSEIFLIIESEELNDEEKLQQINTIEGAEVEELQ